MPGTVLGALCELYHSLFLVLIGRVIFPIFQIYKLRFYDSRPLNLVSQSSKQCGWDLSSGALDQVQWIVNILARLGHMLLEDKRHLQVSLMHSISAYSLTPLAKQVPITFPALPHWLWFSTSFPLSSKEIVLKGSGITVVLGSMNRDASSHSEMWGLFPVGGKRGEGHVQTQLLPGLLQEILSAHLTWSSHQPWWGGSCVALSWWPHPFLPQFSHLENVNNDSTNLARWFKGKWDESGVRGFNFKV